MAVVKNLTISTDKCVGPRSSPTSQLKIRVPMQVSSTVYQSKIPIEIELNRNAKKRDPNETNRCYFYATTVTKKLAYHHNLLTCNMQICIRCDHHVLITTRSFICTNIIKCDVYLMYFICINNNVISMH